MDANTLVPVALADTILRCAEADLFRPLWSAKVVEEAKTAIFRLHPALSLSRVEARFKAMRGAFPEAEGWAKSSSHNLMYLLRNPFASMTPPLIFNAAPWGSRELVSKNRTVAETRSVGKS
ncbi:MAG: hypothetical protein LBO20_09070 [Bifidobacteriaceae bacterium]|nr:hypothetical protein [Bifidobacteriaceae bacterium]